MAKQKQKIEETTEEVEEKKEVTLDEILEEVPEKTEEKKLEPKKTKPDLKDYKYPIGSFCEDSVNVRKRIDRGFAFRTWYKFKNNGSFHDKKTNQEWEVLFNKFMNEPVK